jgi:hypothetical protein
MFSSLIPCCCEATTMKRPRCRHGCSKMSGRPRCITQGLGDASSDKFSKFLRMMMYMAVHRVPVLGLAEHLVISIGVGPIASLERTAGSGQKNCTTGQRCRDHFGGVLVTCCTMRRSRWSTLRAFLINAQTLRSPRCQRYPNMFVLIDFGSGAEQDWKISEFDSSLACRYELQ